MKRAVSIVLTFVWLFLLFVMHLVCFDVFNDNRTYFYLIAFGVFMVQAVLIFIIRKMTNRAIGCLLCGIIYAVSGICYICIIQGIPYSLISFCLCLDLAGIVFCAVLAKSKLLKPGIDNRKKCGTMGHVKQR